MNKARQVLRYLPTRGSYLGLGLGSGSGLKYFNVTGTWLEVFTHGWDQDQG